MITAFTIIRVSGEDQLKGYGPDVQWEYDIAPVAPELGLQVSERYRRVLQESATGWDRAKWEAAVREALADDPGVKKDVEKLEKMTIAQALKLCCSRAG